MTPNWLAHLSILISNLSLVKAQMMCVTSRCTKQSLRACCIFLPGPDQIPPILWVGLLVSVPKNTGLQWKGFCDTWRGRTTLVCFTERTPQLKLPDTQMQVMLEIGNQPLGMCSFWEVLLSAGRAANVQTCVALSTAEAKYIAVCRCPQSCVASTTYKWLVDQGRPRYNHSWRQSIYHNMSG